MKHGGNAWKNTVASVNRQNIEESRRAWTCLSFGCSGSTGLQGEELALDST